MTFALRRLVRRPRLALSALVGSIEKRAEERTVVVSGIEHAPTLRNYLERQTYRIDAAPAELTDPELAQAHRRQSHRAVGGARPSAEAQPVGPEPETRGVRGRKHDLRGAGVDQHAFFTQTTPQDWRRLLGAGAGLCVAVPLVCVLPLLRYVRRPAVAPMLNNAGCDEMANRPKPSAIPAICRNGNRGPTADSSKATAATRPKTSTKAQTASTTGFSSSRPAISGKDTTFQVIRADAPRAG